MKKLMTMVASIAALGMLAACATPGPKIKEDQLKSVKRVAVVGFTSLSEVPDTMKDMGPQMNMGGMANTIPNLNTFAKQTDTAAHIMQNAMNDLNEKMGWKFMTVDQVIRQDAYGDIYLASMKNWKSMMTPDRAYQIHFVKNVLPASISKDFTPQVRDHLMDSLKVDGLVEITYKNQFAKSGFSMAGIGAKHMQSEVMFRLYKKGVAEPIWDDQNAEGAETNDGLSWSMSGYTLSQEPELMGLYEKSAKLADVSLMNRKDKTEK